jgi:hypothetical protein
MRNDPVSLSQPNKRDGVALLKGKTPSDLFHLVGDHLSKLAVKVILTKPGDPLPPPSPDEITLRQVFNLRDKPVAQGHAISLRLLVDGKAIAPAAVDITALARSCFQDDEHWIFTCTCGQAECAAIHRGVIVVTGDHLTVWKAYSLKPCRIVVFDRQQYADEIRNAFAEFMQHHRALSAAAAQCAYFLPREKLEEAFNNSAEARLRELFSRAMAALDFAEGIDSVIEEPMSLRYFRTQVLFPLFRAYGVWQTPRNSDREQASEFKIERQRALAADMLRRPARNLALDLAAWILKLGGKNKFRPEGGWAFAQAVGAYIFKTWLSLKSTVDGVKDLHETARFPDALNETVKCDYFDCEEWLNENWQTLSPRFPGLDIYVFNEMRIFIEEKQARQPPVQTAVPPGDNAKNGPTLSPTELKMMTQMQHDLSEMKPHIAGVPAVLDRASENEREAAERIANFRLHYVTNHIEAAVWDGLVRVEQGKTIATEIKRSPASVSGIKKKLEARCLTKGFPAPWLAPKRPAGQSKQAAKS